ncbi:MAG TPA: response regulator transcription factor [Caulobacteraceae bacterium]|nr:response regulator transcription factor [Caulobacteraceae bacterium]
MVNFTRRVLVIEDDAETAEQLAQSLRASGYDVDLARDGEDGVRRGETAQYAVMTVDRMLPGIDGLEIIRRLREHGVTTPALIISALGEIDDRVRGLRAGGDDYLVKPFAFDELLARVNALARRPPPQDVQTTLRVADLEMNLLRRTVTRGGKRIELQPREFQLLEYLMRHAGKVVTRTMLLEAVWDFHFDPKTNIVETHVSRLRSKVDRNHARELIHTLRGAGYSLREPD